MPDRLYQAGDPFGFSEANKMRTLFETSTLSTTPNFSGEYYIKLPECIIFKSSDGTSFTPINLSENSMIDEFENS